MEHPQANGDYDPPAIRVLGSVEDLTEGAGGTTNDGAGMQDSGIIP